MIPSDFQWPDGIRAAVSLSFDDGRASQLEQAIPILDRHQVRGTFYITPGCIQETSAAWRAALTQGHEMGNHSLRHSCSGNFIWGARNVLETYTLEEMDEELAEANRQLTESLGVRPTTFAYPCGQSFVGRGTERRSYVPLVAHRFIAGRGFRDEHMNRPDFCDLAMLAGTEMDGLTAAEMIATAQRAAADGLWLIFAGHDVRESGRQCVLPRELEAFCAWCRDPAHGIWIDTVAEIATFVRSRRGHERDTNARVDASTAEASGGPGTPP